MKYKVGQKVRSRKTGELFLIIRKNRKGYDVTDDYTEFGTFPEKEFNKEFKPVEKKSSKAYLVSGIKNGREKAWAFKTLKEAKEKLRAVEFQRGWRDLGIAEHSTYKEAKRIEVFLNK